MEWEDQVVKGERRELMGGNIWRNKSNYEVIVVWKPKTMEVLHTHTHKCMQLHTPVCTLTHTHVKVL